MSPNNSPAQVVSTVPDNTPSCAPTVSGKQVGRCPVQESIVNPGQAENPGVISKVAPEPDHVSYAVQPPAKTSHRRVCRQSQQPTLNLLQLGCRSDGIPSGCNDNQVGHDNGLYLPSNCQQYNDVLANLVKSKPGQWKAKLSRFTARGEGPVACTRALGWVHRQRPRVQGGEAPESLTAFTR